MKNQILSALSQNGMSDFSFFLKPEVVSLIPELLQELLDKEKQQFQALKNRFCEENGKNELLSLEKEKLWELIFLEENGDSLALLWEMINHLHQVGFGESFRSIIESFQQEMVAFSDEVDYSKWYYELIKLASLQEGRNEDQIRIFSLRLQAFEQRGIALSTELQSELKAIHLDIAKISDQIQNNLVDEQKAFSYHLSDEELLRDLPEQTALAIRANKSEDGKYLIDANPSILSDMLRYCSDEKVRKELYFLQLQRASKGKTSNKKLILDLLHLKDKKSKILGYDNFASYQLEARMAKNPETAKGFILDIFRQAFPKAQADLESLREYYGLKEMNPWDIPYYTRKYKEEVFAIDREKLKEYFEFNQVLEWLFDFVKEFFALELRLVAEDTYGKVYEVYEDGNLISYFFLDAFYRKGKRPGAWANILRTKSASCVPIVYNVCNFLKNEHGPVLLEISEVETLFHEFGHALHAMLAVSPYPELNGFNVEWDFVELPSQLLERRVKEPESLKRLGKHFRTGEALSEEMITNIQKSQHFMQANRVVRQNELALVDLALYTEEIPQSIEALDAKILEIVNQHSLFVRDERYQMYCGFLHIFGGGYEAGYYSYMRAEALEADVFEKIKAMGIFSSEAGSLYKEKILKAGTRKPAQELFYDFMGRKLEIGALMKKYGLDSDF